MADDGREGKIEELDRTIAKLNDELAKPSLTFDERMKVTDRLLKAFGLRLKFSGTGRGGAFR